MYGQVHKLPTWIRYLGNIRKLKLQMAAMLSEDEIDVLGNLSKLAILSLCFKLFPEGELQFRGRINQLRLLEIGCHSGLRNVVFSSSRFPYLEALKLHFYELSSLQFSGLENLGELKEVWLSGCYDEAFRQNMQIMLATPRPNKIQPVLRLVARSSSDGSEARSR